MKKKRTEAKCKLNKEAESTIDELLAWDEEVRKPSLNQIESRLRFCAGGATCPECGTRLFPLDEKSELLPGSLTPHAHECLVRLGMWVPSFA